FRSPDYGSFNVIAEVAPTLKARGMDFFGWDSNNAFPIMMRGIPNLSEVDGFAWGCERMGPLGNLVGGGWATRGLCCFCRFCQAKGRERGVSADRARTGYQKLDKL